MPSNTKAYNSNSAEQTRTFAERFAQKLKGTEIILLSGPLGAGKTEFVKGLTHGLGVQKKITSPTFILHKSYQTKKFPVHHFDFYRISKQVNLENFGLPDILAEKNRIVIIEWPERIKGLKKMLIGKLITLTFKYGKKPDTRKIEVS